jgi:hypothetical protein
MGALVRMTEDLSVVSAAGQILGTIPPHPAARGATHSAVGFAVALIVTLIKSLEVIGSGPVDLVHAQNFRSF